MTFRDGAATMRRKSSRAARSFSPALISIALALLIAVCALVIDRNDSLSALSHAGRALEAATRLIATVETPF
jgi:hypothetical protein